MAERTALVLINGRIVELPSGDSLAHAEDVLVWNLNGSVTAGIAQDGVRAARKAGTVTGVIVTAGARGNSGDSTFDINLHVPTKPITTQRFGTPGTTIYTTQANRPTITGSTPSKDDNVILEATLPDVIAFAAGDFFSLDVDQAVAQFQDVAVTIYLQYTS